MRSRFVRICFEESVKASSVGPTGSVTTLYQARVRSKEAARERFGKLVLTEMFFESVTSILELCVLSKKLGEGREQLHRG